MTGTLSRRADLPRLIPLAILAVSTASLVAAYTSQYVFGQEPCILCLYQRVPYVVTGVLAVLALGLPAGGAARMVLVTLCGLVFLAGGGLAFYHVGVEQHWWASVASCGGTLDKELSIEGLNALLATPQLKPCDRVDWSLFGISLAGFNAALSLALATATLYGARLLGRTP
jgi:disulfide bond formation protein DsbB